MYTNKRTVGCFNDFPASMNFDLRVNRTEISKSLQVVSTAHHHVGRTYAHVVVVFRRFLFHFFFPMFIFSPANVLFGYVCCCESDPKKGTGRPSQTVTNTTTTTVGTTRAQTTKGSTFKLTNNIINGINNNNNSTYYNIVYCTFKKLVMVSL